MPDEPRTPAVAVVGAATAGAEVASRLADRGVEVTVFEQHARPYGKIEDGLPRWHAKQRQTQYERIAAALDHPLIAFVPNTRIGRDLDLDDLARCWGFDAVVLAVGAWRDRALPVPGIDAWLGRGFAYQNPFVIAFNHAHDPLYGGPTFDVPDGALVVGGGLASVDVAKIHTLECTRRALAERGHALDVETLEAKGIPDALEELGLSWDELGLRGCTLAYRRSLEDMPLLQVPAKADAEKVAKLRAKRAEIAGRVAERYRITLLPNASPAALLTEGGRLVGLRFERTAVDAAGRLSGTGETVDVPASQVVSSIGSIPEPLAGAPMSGELFTLEADGTTRLAGYENVFCVGNAVTGQGNIVASRRHAIDVSDEAIEAYLGLHGGDPGRAARTQEAPLAIGASTASLVQAVIASLAAGCGGGREALRLRVRERQAAVGYTGTFPEWLERAGAPC